MKPASGPRLAPTTLRGRAVLDGVFVALALALLLAGTLSYIYDAVRRSQIEAVRAELRELASIGAAQVDADLALAIHSAGQAGSREHLALLAPLVTFHKATRDLMYVYVARLDGATVRLVAGTDYLYRVAGDTLPPDELYSILQHPDTELLEALRQRRAVVDPAPVAWSRRTYMSAYAPFYDKAGRFVGVVAVDMWVRDLEARLVTVKSAALVGAVSGGAISLLLGLATFAVSLRLRRNWNRELVLNHDLMRTAAALREAAASAESASLAKDAFLATMSHEIRTPINGVLGMVDMLLDTPLDARQQEYARTAMHSARLLLAILGDILDLAKAGEGQLTLHVAPFDLKEALAATGDVIRLQAKRKGVSVTTTFTEGAPSAFVGDVTRIEQVLLNLASNAEKFTERGSIQIGAELAPVVEGRCRITLSVTDTGIGIAASDLDRIFERFTQADSTSTRNVGGAGLGLAICRMLVGLMGGHIGVRSVPGQGSRFWVELELPIADGASAAPLAAPTAATPSISGKRVLVVDDNEVNRMVAVMTLRRIGCEVDEVDGGDRAIRAVAARPYDLVLMDCEMPGVDGYDATRRIRAAEAGGARRTRIAAMTANALAGDRERCLRAGMDDYVAKPVTAKLLAALVARGGEAVGADPGF